jgi:putative membrane protein
MTAKPDGNRTRASAEGEKSRALDLGLERTVLAAERTLMAWIRTAISLITFGFTLYKFLQYTREAQGLTRAGRGQGPRNLGLTLLGLAMVILVVANIEHCRYLIRIGAPARRSFGSPFFVALFLFVLASLLFVGVLIRWKFF